MFHLKHKSFCLATSVGKSLFPRVLIHQSSLTCDQHKEQLTENQKINPLVDYINRNPRNLERLALAQKDRGWGRGFEGNESTNHPSRCYYHRVYMDVSSRHVTMSVEHSSGDTVIEASTLEPNIRMQLYAGSGVNTCENVGRILGERCLRAGISCVEWPLPEEASDSLQAARQAMESVGVSLQEPSPRNLRYNLPHWKPTGPLPVQLDGVVEPATPKQVSNE